MIFSFTIVSSDPSMLHYMSLIDSITRSLGGFDETMLHSKLMAIKNPLYALRNFIFYFNLLLTD